MIDGELWITRTRRLCVIADGHTMSWLHSTTQCTTRLANGDIVQRSGETYSQRYDSDREAKQHCYRVSERAVVRTHNEGTVTAEVHWLRSEVHTAEAGGLVTTVITTTQADYWDIQPFGRPRALRIECGRVSRATTCSRLSSDLSGGYFAPDVLYDI